MFGKPPQSTNVWIQVVLTDGTTQTLATTDAHGRRYRYAAQPPIAQWNLARLAETLLPLLPGEGPGTIDHARNTLTQIRGVPGVETAFGALTWPVERERAGAGVEVNDPRASQRL